MFVFMQIPAAVVEMVVAVPVAQDSVDTDYVATETVQDLVLVVPLCV